MDGEIKSMDRGVVVVSTDYSDSDLKIKWEEIQEISTQTDFFITLSDGRKFYGRITSRDASTVNIITLTGLLFE